MKQDLSSARGRHNARTVSLLQHLNHGKARNHSRQEKWRRRRRPQVIYDRAQRNYRTIHGALRLQPHGNNVTSDRELAKNTGGQKRHDKARSHATVLRFKRNWGKQGVKVYIQHKLRGILQDPPRISGKKNVVKSPRHNHLLQMHLVKIWQDLDVEAAWAWGITGNRRIVIRGQIN
jgi:hypothetical protein